MTQGLLYTLAAGILISFQNVFATRTGEKLGFWETNTFIHGAGFVFALIILCLNGRGSQNQLFDVNRIYLAGCFIGVLVVFTIMQGVTRLGVGLAVPLMLATQVLASVIISRFGLFGERIQIPNPMNMIGLLMVIGGAVLCHIKS